MVKRTAALSATARGRSVGAWEVGSIPREGREPLILGREKRRPNRPLDAYQRVVPGNPGLVLRRIELRALVDDVRDVRQDAQTVSESWRDPKAARLIAAKRDAMPAAEGRRVAANIHGDVEYESTNHGDELALG